MSVQRAPFAALIGADTRFTTSSPAPDILDAVVFDADGSGPQSPRLIVTGFFRHMGGVYANGIAAFDGERWIPMGAGLNTFFAGSNSRPGGNALAVHRGELFIGGDFSQTISGTFGSQEQYLNSLARWNGMTFEPAYRSSQPLNLNSVSGAVFGLASAHGVLYLAGPNLEFNNLPGVGSISYGARLSESGLSRLPTPHSQIANIVRVGDEVFYGPAPSSSVDSAIVVGWNGTSARVLPYPENESVGSVFPFCAIEDNGSIIFGGNIGPNANSPTFGALRWTGEWSRLPNFPSPSRVLFSRVTNIDSFSKRDGSIFAFTWPDVPNRSPMQRLVNDQWVDEPLQYTGFTTENNHIRGEVTFQNRRFLYGKISATATTQSSRLTLPNPANLIAEVDPTNRIIPISGLYNAYLDPFVLPTSHRPVVRVDNQLIMGGPTGFSFGGARLLYVAGWDGTSWNRVASNDLANAPVDLAWHNNELFALSRVAPTTQTAWQLLRRDASSNWTPAAPPLFSGEAQLLSHQGELYIFVNSAQNGSNVHRLTASGTLAPVAAVSTSTSGRRLAVSVGTDLFFGVDTSLQRLSGSAWQTIPLTGGPANANLIFAHNGALHSVDTTGSGATLTIRLHRLNGTTWTLVSSTLVTNATNLHGADVIDGDIYIAGNRAVFKFAASGTWSEYTWPIFNSTSFPPPSGTTANSVGSNARFTTIKDHAGRILIRGAFDSVGPDPSVNIAVLAPTPITINWPPLPRTGLIGSAITIGVGASGQQSLETGLSYQWLRDGLPLVNGTTPAGTRMAGTTARRLTLTDARAADAGLYSVRISLACGTSVTTDPVPITITKCNDIDFNNNTVFPEDQDVIDFFNVLAGAECLVCDDIDFNNNSVFPEDQDVIDFFTVLAGGTCS